MLTPDTPDIVLGETPAQPNRAMRRSWKKGGEAGAFDFKFESKDPFTDEVTTVFCRYAKDRESVGKVQDELFDEAKEIQNSTLQLKTLSDKIKDTNGQDMGALEELQSLVTTVRTSTSLFNTRQLTTARDLLSECVIGWKNAPIAFSPEVLADLPDDLCLEWMPQVVNASRLGEKEAAFLADSSTPSSEGNHSPG